MRSESRFSAITSRFTILGPLVVGLWAVAGCNPHKDQLRPENLLGRIGSKPTGQVIEPKKCMIRVMILNRPFRDPVLNEVVWKAVDEQAIAPEERRVLQTNGIRMGRITGDIPPELESIIDAPPPNKVEPASFFIDEGDQSLLNICDAVDQISLLLNRDDRVFGKDYNTASGYYRVTPQHHDGGAVSLRFTPEIHHGPIQRSYQPLQQSASFAPQQFKIADGQQEETLRDLSANIVLEPGQVTVLGCIPEQERSLGSFLFTLADTHNDQRRQRLVLVWASRNQVGVVEDKDTSRTAASVLDRKAKDVVKAEMTAAKDEPKK